MVKSVELPYPPVSPKYRRDMRSKVPIFPPPPRKVDSGHQKGDAPIVSSTTNEAHPQSISDNLGPRNVPMPRPSTIPHSKPTHNLTHAPPSQPSHSHTTHKLQAHKTAPISVPVTQPKKTIVKPPQTSYSSPIRKLLFDSHGKQPSTSQLRAQHATKKFVSSSSQQYTKTSGVPSAKSSQSLSSLSLSSCSVASDMLQKARERRDRFWTQPSHITAS